ncbi:MAG: hypothetical protein ACRC1T_09190 [Clostridium chrysemydis]|uniref:hypothetical protein n=1 Tax=Clostridium chrysemydis TaxID=2665504 RepID=UPI003F40C060
MAVSFKRLKEIAEKAKETHLIDFEKLVDKRLKGLIVPVRVKSIEECIKLKREFKLKNSKMTIEHKPFSRMPKAFRTMYMEDEAYRKGQTEVTYFQLCRLDVDESKISTVQHRERIFNIVIHFDMEYKTEDGKNLWEECGIAKDDYNGLVNIFSDIMVFPVHLDIMDLIIDQIKNGVTNETSLSAVVFNYGIRKTIDSIEDEGEREQFIKNYTKMVEDAQKRIETSMKELEETEDNTVE